MGTTIYAQATLRTARLELVPLGPEHSKFTKKLDMDPTVMKHVGFGRPFTAEEATQSHAWLLNCAKSVPGLGAWAGFADGDFVGWWILAPVPLCGTESQSECKEQAFYSDRTEYGFRISPTFWGQGYAKDGARELVRHAFQDLGLVEVAGETMTVNVASRAVMARCGLKHVDTFFNTYDTPPPGIEEGEVRYVITRDDWLLRGSAPN